jgi:sugar/nucleoside kinase (ribokinase family)
MTDRIGSGLRVPAGAGAGAGAGAPMIRRLVSIGNVIVDVVAAVHELPRVGGDVLASSGTLTAGGSAFNVLVASSRLGLPSAYAGAHGTGPLADLVRSSLHTEGIAVLTDATPEGDTGFTVALVDFCGERTFVTVAGAERGLDADRALGGLRHGDAVHVSGYGLLHPDGREAAGRIVRQLPQDAVVLYDPGPLGPIGPIGPDEASRPGARSPGQCPRSTSGRNETDYDTLAAIFARADWWSGNAREATAATGETDAVAAARALAPRMARGGVIVRCGEDGCVLVEPGSDPRQIRGFPARALDTNGAGDTHVGAFLAALADGCDAPESARRANAAAAIAVAKRGPATGPDRAALERFLAS